MKPALLSRGDRSAPFFPAVVAQIARAMPQAAQHLFAGAGHVPHLEQPDAYVEVVRRFIGRVQAEATVLAPETGERELR